MSTAVFGTDIIVRKAPCRILEENFGGIKSTVTRKGISEIAKLLKRRLERTDCLGMRYFKQIRPYRQIGKAGTRDQEEQLAQIFINTTSR